MEKQMISTETMGRPIGYTQIIEGYGWIGGSDQIDGGEFDIDGAGFGV